MPVSDGYWRSVSNLASRPWPLGHVGDCLPFPFADVLLLSCFRHPLYVKCPQLRRNPNRQSARMGPALHQLPSTGGSLCPLRRRWAEQLGRKSPFLLTRPCNRNFLLGSGHLRLE